MINMSHQPHNVDIISIGNGTASKETEMFAADAIKEAENETDLSYRESALNFIFKRRKYASLVQALLIEEWLIFRQKQVEENPYISVEMKRSLDVSGYGPLLKGQTYLLKRDDASALVAKGLAITPNFGDVRKYEWPTKYQETNGGIMRPRAIGEKLYRVEEKFRDNGIEYKPGDMVLKREIKPENLQKCKDLVYNHMIDLQMII